jgi:hypothetical protein
MTIVVAVALPEAVVLMADGRHANQVEIITDSAQKIFALGDRLALGVCGAVMGTDLAVEDLRRAQPGDLQALADRLSYLSQACARHVLSLVIPETQASAHIKVGLIAGGFEGNQAFLAGGLFGTGMASPDRQVRLATDCEPQAMVLGGEGVGANRFFLDRLTETLTQESRSGGLHSEAWVSAILAAGASTIRYASEHDRTIGGRRHFRILRRNGPEQSGAL